MLARLQALWNGHDITDTPPLLKRHTTVAAPSPPACHRVKTRKQRCFSISARLLRKNTPRRYRDGAQRGSRGVVLEAANPQELRSGGHGPICTYDKRLRGGNPQQRGAGGDPGAHRPRASIEIPQNPGPCGERSGEDRLHRSTRYRGGFESRTHLPALGVRRDCDRSSRDAASGLSHRQQRLDHGEPWRDRRPRNFDHG